MFKRNGTSWTQQDKFTANDGSAYDNFGFSVSFDNSTIIISSYNKDIGASTNAGKVYFFEK